VGAVAVISGNFGPKAAAALSSAGIKMYLFSGTVSSAMESFAKGKLDEVKSDVGAGFGFAGRGRGRI